MMHQKMVFFVVKGIDKNGINDLIRYTNSDRLIKKYTHDFQRFADLDTYLAWRKSRRFIYTLIDENCNLSGVIWFSRKINPIITKPHFSFAVRTYPPARGQGVAKKFIRVVIKDFLKGSNSTLWLTVNNGNKIAIHLYKSFGFKEIKNWNQKEKLMVYRSSS